MRKLIHSAITSLDGYVEDSSGGIGWSEPDEALHRFANERARATGAYLMGRGLYETMVPFWPDLAGNPTGCDYIDEFARIFDRTPRFVVSESLNEVDSGSQLLVGDLDRDSTNQEHARGGHRSRWSRTRGISRETGSR